MYKVELLAHLQARVYHSLHFLSTAIDFFARVCYTIEKELGEKIC